MPRAALASRPALVTGGAGFIGSHLVDALLGADARVRVLDNLSTGSDANLEHCRERIDFVAGDIRDLATCRAACEGIEVVFHQAALGSVPRSLTDPATTIGVNVAGSANVFTAAREKGVARIVYASSSSVYGDSDTLPRREGSEGSPLSPYAWSKRMAEELAEAFTSAFEIELVGLRYFNVYGPRQTPEGPYAAVIPRFFAAALAGRPAQIHGDGEQSRDFTAVADAVRANLLAAGAPADASGEVFNVAAGEQTSVNQLAAAVFSSAGVPLEVESQPPRDGDVRHSHADLTRAREVLGYEPEQRLAAGLESSLAFYRELFLAADLG